MTITVTGTNYVQFGTNANILEGTIQNAGIGAGLVLPGRFESSQTYPGYSFLLTEITMDDVADFASNDRLVFALSGQFGIIATLVKDVGFSGIAGSDAYDISGVFITGSGNTINGFYGGGSYTDATPDTLVSALVDTSGPAGDNYLVGLPKSGVSFSPIKWTGFTWNFTQFMDAAAALRAGNSAPLNALLNGETYRFDGGSVGERFTGYALNDTLFGNGGSDTLDGGGGNDLVAGGDEGDSLTGGAGLDSMFGDGGNDTMFGGADNDAMSGGAGSDTLYGGEGGDTLTGGIGVDALVGDAGADLLEGNQDDDELQGGDGSDSLFGNDGADRLYGDMALILGPTGNDTLDGGADLDTLWGGTGDDTYIIADITGGIFDVVNENASAGTDTVQLSAIAGAPAYYLPNNVENLTGVGNAALDLYGNNLENVITGNTAANLLSGLAGWDTLIGGQGNDVYILDTTASSPSLVLRAYDQVVEAVDGGTDTVIVWRGLQSTRFDFFTLTTVDTYWSGYTLPDNIEVGTVGGTDDFNLTGNGLGNTLTGNGAKNLLAGAGGNDSLDGGAGRDTLAGGADNDTYYLLSTSSDPAFVNLVYDDVSEAAGGGYDTVIVQRAAQSSFLNPITFQLQQTFWSEYVLPAEIEEGQIYGAGTFGLTGNGGDNRLVGNDDGNVLSGAGGNDTLVGNGGDDTFVGGDGNDRFEGGFGTDWASYAFDVQGVAANLFGGYIVQNAGQPGAMVDAVVSIENIFGSNGDDFFVGNDIANRLEGGFGADNLWGYGGNDTLIGGDGNDIIVGGDNDDSLESGIGQDWLYGQGGADTLRATDATANAFNVLVGGDGNDTLFGGPTGFDYFYGGDGVTGGGNDTFVIVANSGIKVMNDFEAGGVNDVVRLTGTALTTFSQVQAKLSFSATINGTVLVVDGATQVWFLGLQPNQLTASDFAYL